MELKRIIEVFDEKGIKHIWLADKLGKSFSSINASACNQKQQSLEVLHEIVEILQVDLKKLIIDKKEEK